MRLLHFQSLSLAAMLGLSWGCQQQDWPLVNIGLNQPAPGSARAFAWAPVAGASSYLVSVSLDGLGAQQVGVTGFTSDLKIETNRVVWQSGHPIEGRTYFWSLLAYDSPSRQGLLLFSSRPQEIQFSAADLAPGLSPVASGALITAP